MEDGIGEHARLQPQVNVWHTQLDGVDTLDAVLARLDVPHTIEVYDGDHGNRVRERFEMHVLPFFSRHLTAR